MPITPSQRLSVCAVLSQPFRLVAPRKQDNRACPWPGTLVDLMHGVSKKEKPTYTGGGKEVSQTTRVEKAARYTEYLVATTRLAYRLATCVAVHV